MLLSPQRVLLHRAALTLSARDVTCTATPALNAATIHPHASSRTLATTPPKPSKVNVRTVAAGFSAVALSLTAYSLLTPPPKPVLQRERQPQPTFADEEQQRVQQEQLGEAESSSSPDEEASSALPPDGASVSSEATTAAAGAPAGPWSLSEEMQMQLHRRSLADNRLRAYIKLKEHELQNWLTQMDKMGVKLTPEQFEQHMLQLEQEVNRDTSLILYQVPSPTARRDYLAEYGCTKWSEEALEAIAQYSPIIEIGAGLGHWQKALSEKGADVYAVDNRSALPLPDVRIKRPRFVGNVVHGDETFIQKYPKRTLLLVYPGPDDMAIKSLQQYKGDVLLYVGEPRGGVNASPAFFDALEKDWECVGTHPVEPFPNGMEKLWVLKRKKGGKSRGWLW